jgi:hypothetical protein
VVAAALALVAIVALGGLALLLCLSPPVWLLHRCVSRSPPSPPRGEAEVRCRAPCLSTMMVGGAVAGDSSLEETMCGHRTKKFFVLCFVVAFQEPRNRRYEVRTRILV